MKRKLEDVSRKLEILYDRLREENVSSFNQSSISLTGTSCQAFVLLHIVTASVLPKNFLKHQGKRGRCQILIMYQA